MNAPANTYRRVADRARTDDLILRHLPLVKHVLARIVADVPRGVDIENLEAAGVLGLVEAAGNFDPQRNTQFKTFAYLRVRGAILDEMRRNCPLPQMMTERISKVRRAYRLIAAPVTVEALSAATGLTSDEVSDALAAVRLTKMISWEQTALPNGLGLLRQSEPPEVEVERWERNRLLAEAIRELSPRDQKVVTLYYRDDLRLREISEVMGLSESRLSRILSAAMFELGERIRAAESGSKSSHVGLGARPAAAV